MSSQMLSHALLKFIRNSKNNYGFMNSKYLQMCYYSRSYSVRFLGAQNLECPIHLRFRISVRYAKKNEFGLVWSEIGGS